MMPTSNLPGTQISASLSRTLFYLTALTIILCQKSGFKKYKAPIREGLLIQYAMCLPFFIPLGPKLISQIYIWNRSQLFNIITLTAADDNDVCVSCLPLAWILVIFDSITQVSLIFRMKRMRPYCNALTLISIIFCK